MKKFFPDLIKYQLYIFQLEEYDRSRFIDAIIHKGLLPTTSLRKQLNWTLKAKLILTITIILELAVTLFDSYLIGILLFKSIAAFVIFLFVDLFVVYYFSFIFLITASIILWPVEYFEKIRIISRAKAKYKRLKTTNQKLRTIGITGSYGKTTMKETLATILSESFKVVSTPENINTPLGLARVILNSLSEDTEVFVVEMGEYVKGDVDALCQIAKPDMSIITGINEAHLERYGTMKNAIDTKFEIVENTPEDGLVLLNADDKLTKEHYKKFIGNRKLQWYSTGEMIGGNYKIVKKELDTDKLVQKFEIKTPKEHLQVTTHVIAEYIGGNIIAGMLMGKELGMSDSQVRLGISQLKPAPHRLETKRSGDIIVIDDTYNGNSSGIKEGIKLLSRFKGHRKVYVTPGLVETGDLKEEIHREIGKDLAKVADLVILTRNSATPFIAEGLEHENFNMNNIVWFNTSKETYEKLREHLQSGDVVMMQNDWSDNYY